MYTMYKGGSRVGERGGGEVEAPQAPRGWGLGKGCPPPNGRGLERGLCPLPEFFFEFYPKSKWRISVHSAICSSNFGVRECLA